MANALILAVISLYLLARITLNYNGRYGAFFFFGGERHPCTRSEYVMETAGFLLFGLLDDPVVWVPILLALGVLPFIGYLIDCRREPKSML